MKRFSPLPVKILFIEKLIAFFFVCTSIFLFQMQHVFAIASMNKLETLEFSIKEDKSFILFTYDHILPGEELLKLQTWMQESENFVSTASQKKQKRFFSSSFRNLLAAKKIQHKLLKSITQIYRKRTKKLFDYVQNQYSQITPKKPLARKYLNLGKQEATRAQIYLNSRHNKLAIHTYRLARSYYFFALAKIIREIPTQFNLELTDLSSLPNAYYPPQLRIVENSIDKSANQQNRIYYIK
jgi:hypothetical protein